jgi:hypothetical protein
VTPVSRARNRLQAGRSCLLCVDGLNVPCQTIRVSIANGTEESVEHRPRPTPCRIVDTRHAIDSRRPRAHVATPGARASPAAWGRVGGVGRHPGGASPCRIAARRLTTSRWPSLPTSPRARVATPRRSVRARGPRGRRWGHACRIAARGFHSCPRARVATPRPVRAWGGVGGDGGGTCRIAAGRLLTWRRRVADRLPGAARRLSPPCPRRDAGAFHGLRSVGHHLPDRGRPNVARRRVWHWRRTWLWAPPVGHGRSSTFRMWPRRDAAWVAVCPRLDKGRIAGITGRICRWTLFIPELSLGDLQARASGVDENAVKPQIGHADRLCG